MANEFFSKMMRHYFTRYEMAIHQLSCHVNGLQLS